MHVIAMAMRTGLVTVRNRPPIDDCPECERCEVKKTIPIVTTPLVDRAPIISKIAQPKKLKG